MSDDSSKLAVRLDESQREDPLGSDGPVNVRRRFLMVWIVERF